jgi:hypothetical protein
LRSARLNGFFFAFNSKCLIGLFPRAISRVGRIGVKLWWWRFIISKSWSPCEMATSRSFHKHEREERTDMEPQSSKWMLSE